MVEHSAIVDGERHEPKGADSATIGQVYVSDGANSGAWAKTTAANTTVLDSAGWFTATEVEAALAEIMNSIPGGWGFYEDDGGAGQVISTTDTKLSINGAGSGTDVGSIPLAIRGSGALWDTSGDRITPIVTDDAYQVRLDLPITAVASSPTQLELQLDISAGATAASVVVSRYIDISQGVSTVSVAFPVACIADFNTNGGQIFLTTDVGTATITGPSILLVRTHNGNM